MLSFQQKRNLFRSYSELSESTREPDRLDYKFEGSKQRRKVVVTELSQTGNAYLYGGYLAGYNGPIDERGWINVKDYSLAELEALLDRVLDSFK